MRLFLCPIDCSQLQLGILIADDVDQCDPTLGHVLKLIGGLRPLDHVLDPLRHEGGENTLLVDHRILGVLGEF